MLNLDLKSVTGRLTLIALLCAAMYSTAFAEKGNKPKGGIKPGKPNQRMLGDGGDGGYLFVDGEYIPLPYHFKKHNSCVTTSGTDVGLMKYLRASSASKNCLESGERRQLEEALQQICIQGHAAKTLVALFCDAPPIVLNKPSEVTDVLLLLTENGDLERVNRGRPKFLPASFPSERWYRWVREFCCTEEFASRARSYITRVDLVENDSRFSIATLRYAENSVYPLSVLGMLAVVLSFGHLLSTHPSADCEKHSQTLSPATNRIICRTLILIFVLSALDLLWTILAIRTGSMREVNPLGNRFIGDPLSLTFFKASATAMAVCLLYALRHHLLARKAAWWVCLVCTLVAARWVTFNSMFIP